MSSFTKKDLENIIKNPYRYAQKMSVKKLVDILKYASDRYYKNDKPIFSDEIYDILVELLMSVDKNNTFLKKINVSLEKTSKVKLPFYMSSLDKIKLDQKIFNKWISKYTGIYHLSDKIDGVSALLYLENNKMSLFTRGNGFYGTNISFLIDEIQGIINLKEIDIIKNKKIAIRGELIISKKDFHKLQKIDTSLKNARNTVAGIVNSKPNNFKKYIAKYITFLAYDIMFPNLQVDEQYKLLEHWKFKMPYNLLTKHLTLEYLNKFLEDRRKTSKYDIDGIVVRDNNIHTKIEGEKPKYAFAFKSVFTDQIAEVKVLDVEWIISKDKILNPVVVVDKVVLGGVDVRRATGFNAKFIKDNKIGPGAIIKIIRSGDVIPHILEVIKPIKEWKKPEILYKWTGTEVDIIALFSKNNSKESKWYKKQYDIVLMNHFFTVLGVHGMSIGTITKLYNGGYNTIQKIINASSMDFEIIEGFGRKLSEKIYDAIKKSILDINLPTLMTATNMFGRGWSDRKFHLVLNKISFDELLLLYKKPDKLSDKLMNIEGLSDVTTKQFIKGLPKFINFLKSHSEITFTIKKEEKEKEKGKFFGQTFVFSGFRDKKLEQLIKENGGTVSDQVSSKTTTLIVNDINITTTKTDKAKLLGIKIVTLDTFIKK